MNDETSDDKKQPEILWSYQSWNVVVRARSFLNDWLLFLLIHHINLHTIRNFVTMRVPRTEERESFKILLSMWNDLGLVNTVYNFVNIVHTRTHPKNLWPMKNDSLWQHKHYNYSIVAVHSFESFIHSFKSSIGMLNEFMCGSITPT